MSADTLIKLQEDSKIRNAKRKEEETKEALIQSVYVESKIPIQEIMFIDGSDIEQAKLFFTSSGNYRRYRSVLNEILKLKPVSLPNKIKKGNDAIDYEAVSRFVASINKPEIKQRANIIELPVAPDEKKPFKRPPAIYSNSSPYGIAAEMLREQGK